MDLFNTPNEIDQIKVEDYVGEGKQFPTVKHLLKSKFDSNNFVTELQREKQEEVERIRQELMAEAARQRLQSQNANGSEGNQQVVGTSQTQGEQSAAPLTFEDIDQFLEQKKAKEREAENLQKVAETILRYAGTEEKARTVLADKAKELGLPLEKLNDLAKTSPRVLFTLLGISETKTNSVLPTDKKVGVPTVQPALNTRNPQTLEDIAEIRRTNPNRYNSPEVQLKMMELRRAEIQNRK